MKTSEQPAWVATNPAATTALIAGVLGLFIPFCSPIALVYGLIGLNRARAINTTTWGEFTRTLTRYAFDTKGEENPINGSPWPALSGIILGGVECVLLTLSISGII